MRSTIVFFFIVFVFMSSSAGATGPVQVQLIDGSMISGEIISFKEGVYRLRSDSLGTIAVDEAQIKVIHMDSTGTAPWEPVNTSNGSMDSTLQTLQKSITQDPQIMEMILTLQNDPDIQGLLQDPAIINALSAGDINTLMSSPEFIKILEHPTIQHIQGEAIK